MLEKSKLTEHQTEIVKKRAEILSKMMKDSRSLVERLIDSKYNAKSEPHMGGGCLECSRPPSPLVPETDCAGQRTDCKPIFDKEKLK